MKHFIWNYFFKRSVVEQTLEDSSVSKNVQVLFLNTSSKIGGAERSLIDVIDTLSPKLIPTVILPHKDELYNILQNKANVEIVEILHLKRGLGLLFKNSLKIINHVYKLSCIMRRRKIDIIYSNTLSGQVYAVLLKMVTGKLVIWHVRDNVNCRVLAFILGLFSNKIICISKHIVQQILFKKKVELVYNGINTEVWKIDSSFKNKIKDELKIDRKTVMIGHIGQLIPWKRHDLFIDVATLILDENNCNVHFVIIGNDLFNDFPEYKENLKQRIESRDGISFLQYKSNLSEYLNGIDILIHLADNEPFGRILIEAMALEKPVIAKLSGGPKEVIKDNISGYLISQADPATIAHKLKILINNDGLRNQFGKEGRKNVENNFSIKNLQQINKIIFSVSEKYFN